MSSQGNLSLEFSRAFACFATTTYTYIMTELLVSMLWTIHSLGINNHIVGCLGVLDLVCIGTYHV